MMARDQAGGSIGRFATRIGRIVSDRLSSLSLLQVMRFVAWPRRIVVVAGLLLTSMVELLGLTMILPVLAAIIRPDHLGSGFGLWVGRQLQSVGLPATLEALLGAYVGLLFLKAAIGIGVGRYVADVISDIAQSVRLHLARNLLHVRWSYFVRQPVGKLANLMGHEANAMGDTFYVAANFLSHILHIAVYLTVAAILSWQLGLICLGVGLAMFLWFGRLIGHTKQVAQRHANQIVSLAGNFADTVTSIRPIKAMGRQARFAGLFEADARMASRAVRARVLSSEFSNEVQEPVIGLVLAMGFYVSIRLWALPFEEMLLLGFILARTIQWFYGIQRVYHRMVLNEPHFRQVMTTLQETTDEKEDLSGRASPTLVERLKLENVDFSYGTRPVLHNVSFDIAAGTVVALVGPSGAGKSTLTDLILGLQQPIAGRITIDGVVLRDVDLLKWRAGIGYVPQELTLFHDSILRNVTLGDEHYSIADVERALTFAAAREFVERLPDALNHDVGERGLGLSGGQRQRISIARALVHQPRLLILDEPTTAVDPDTEAEICRNVRRLAEQEGVTVLVISHQPSWHAIADQIVTLDNGMVTGCIPGPASPISRTAA